MDYKKVFYSILFAFLVGFAFFSWVVNLNTKYVPLGATAIDTGFYSDVEPIYAFGNTTARSTGDATGSTGVSSSATEAAISQSRGTFGILRDMINFVPNLIGRAASYLGLPDQYATIAGWAFIFGFAITLAYLLLTGSSNTGGE